MSDIHVGDYVGTKFRGGTREGYVEEISEGQVSRWHGTHPSSRRRLPLRIARIPLRQWHLHAPSTPALW
jgi:hypothetical protein